MKKFIFCFAFLCMLFLTGKSFSQIDSNWVKRYAGSQNSDEPRAMIIDASNNVYITGRSLTASNGYDIVTIKYNSSGTVLWTAVYNGPGSTNDEGTSIAMDGTTNLYVGGITTRSPSTGYDYVTIKYNVTTGALIWASIFNGVGNIDDILTKMAAKSNSVYVTGKGYYKDATNADYVTIKYNGATGDSTWVRTYNGTGNGNDSATFIKITTDSSIVVTGKSYGSGNYDFATIKYSAAGTQNWAKRLNGAANLEDFGLSISFNTTTSPDIYVTGNSQGTGTGYDIFTVKYTSAGVESWNRRYNGTANLDDFVGAFQFKNDNEIYINGSATNTGSGSDIVLLKYDLNGNLLLTVNYNGSANGNDEGTAIAIDASGFIYFAGKSNETSTGIDYVTIKYSSAGGVEWSYKYNKSGSGTDAPSAIVVDATTDRNVYVTGASFTGTTGTNYTTIKLKQDKVLDLNFWIQGFYKPATNSMVRDTVRVKLYNSTGITIIDSAKIYLDTLGKGRLYFKVAANATGYYLVIKHRNLIETWGASTSSFSNLYLTYDFTNAITKAYGSNLVQVDNSPNEFAGYNCDVNQDGSVDAVDIIDVYNDVNNVATGYVSTDTNGDDIVDVTDMISTFNNSNNSVSVVRP